MKRENESGQSLGSADALRSEVLKASEQSVEAEMLARMLERYQAIQDQLGDRIRETGDYVAWIRDLAKDIEKRQAFHQQAEDAFQAAERALKSVSETKALAPSNPPDPPPAKSPTPSETG